MKKVRVRNFKVRKFHVDEEVRNFYNGIFIDLGELAIFTGKVV